jgi:hypothetical protein
LATSASNGRLSGFCSSMVVIAAVPGAIPVFEIVRPQME